MRGNCRAQAQTLSPSSADPSDGGAHTGQAFSRFPGSQKTPLGKSVTNIEETGPS